MLRSGRGRRSWRELFPTTEWSNVERHQISGVRLLLLRKGPVEHPSSYAVLKFHDDLADHELIWELHYHGTEYAAATSVLDQQKDQLEDWKRAMDSNLEPAGDYSFNPDFGRF